MTTIILQFHKSINSMYHLNRVSTDNFAIETLGELESKAAFSGAGGAGDDDDLLFLSRLRRRAGGGV